ncbi:hypothetical protein BSS2_I0411 [Brucella suis bv. 1 str. S2]|uniref:Uncharacterized protein n=7 Tax=Brucella TaxID=234 RepID=Q57EU6_BRUAB|nr:hypothetical protein BR0419 [Brucella suis 1330]AAX73838.1 hypothetical protein BruAb1_0442 [Brucella abortus bv. 1 str. 9-941]ABQ60134.1 hypothetical protein BOV_0427 [Brucella ovis ATCC 25840]ACD71951.1 hypothetical protein BAbS19_I04120 [Brucella abortus S19]ACO00233.1 Hypothetical protein, conserved [Brucella melitensis ATCC 23457]ACU47432.1 hypothetical protein BMI_I423 [Brucella microti CCM 4915]ADZ86384.1 conserved hypothetical protein [Brucella melitensis M5-90]AEK53757.1 hypothet
MPYRTGFAILQAIADKKAGIVTLLAQSDNTFASTD